MLKKYIACIGLCIVAIINCSGCSSQYKIGQEKDEFMTIQDSEFEDEVNRISKIIESAIIDGNFESIKVEFCEDVKRKCDLDSGLNDITKFIDGNVTTIGSIIIGPGGRTTDEKFGVVEQDFDISFYDIKTDEGLSYNIYCMGIYYCKDHPELKGITAISVEDNIKYEEKNNPNFDKDESYYSVHVGEQ